MREIQETVTSLIEEQSVAFIASIDPEGFPIQKAMLAPRKREGLRIFYFTTNTSSMRVGQYRGNPKANIYFCDQRLWRGVLFKGGMEVLEDAASKELIWQNGDTMYYAGGVTDPDYCVLRFTAKEGRFYSNFTSVNFHVE